MDMFSIRDLSLLLTVAFSITVLADKPMDISHGIQQLITYHRQFYQTTIEGLLLAVGKETMKKLRPWDKQTYRRCYARSQDLTTRAKCLTAAFDYEASTSTTTNVKWIGSFGISSPYKTLRDSPIPRATERLLDNSMKNFVGPQIMKTLKLLGNGAPKMNVTGNSAADFVAKIADSITGALRKFSRENSTHDSTYEKLKQLQAIISRNSTVRKRIQSSGASQFYDATIANGRHYNAMDPMELLDFVGEKIPIIRETLGPLLAMASKSKIGQLEALSPRLMPLFPKTNGASLLSPSLLSLYKGRSSQDVASLPRLLSGFNSRFQHSLLELLLEVSGSRSGIDKAFQILRNHQKTNNDFVLANARMDKMWNKLNSSYTRKQKHELRSKGYAFLDVRQLEGLYGRNGFFNYTEHNIDLHKYAKLNTRHKMLVVKDSIRQLAGVTSSSSKLGGWNKRLQQAVVFSPLAFTPIIGVPFVLGPIVLSPTLFSPIVLDTFVLSPIILSPNVGSPLVLSPYVLSPIILTPVALKPFVLSPNALSPPILNPNVLSPNVLSPFVLSPGLLIPNALSPFVLNPFALSPAILNPATLSGLVLSPNVLSPPLLSPQVLSAFVLSPSVLS